MIATEDVDNDQPLLSQNDTHNKSIEEKEDDSTSITGVDNSSNSFCVPQSDLVQLIIKNQEERSQKVQKRQQIEQKIKDKCDERARQTVKKDDKTRQSDKETTEEVEKDDEISQLNYSADDNHSDKFTGDPQAMDLRMVMMMFKEIKSDLNQLKKEREEVEKIEGIMYQQQFDGEQIEHLTTKLEKNEEKTQMMQGVLQGMATQMQQMNSRICDLERQSVKNCIIFSGFYGSDDKDECIEQVQAFFRRPNGH